MRFALVVLVFPVHGMTGSQVIGLYGSRDLLGFQKFVPGRLLVARQRHTRKSVPEARDMEQLHTRTLAKQLNDLADNTLAGSAHSTHQWQSGGRRRRGCQQSGRKKTKLTGSWSSKAWV